MKHSMYSAFGLVEIVVGVSILSLVMFATASFFQSTLRASETTQSTIQANFLLEEGVEAVKLLRDKGYATNILTLSTTTPYYLSWTGSAWTTGTTTVLVGNFVRTIQIADVARNATDDIDASGIYDPNTKKVTVSVSWSTPAGTSTRSLSTYLTNIFSN